MRSALIERTGDDQLELAARNRQIDFLLELDRLPQAESALRELALRAGDSADPRADAYVSLHRARLAIVEGRYEEAEGLNAEAAGHGARLRDTTLLALTRVQLFSLRWAQGRLAELESATRQAAGADATPAWPAALALLCCEVGKDEDARRELERLAARDFEDLPRYNGWLVTMALLAEVSVRLGDLRRAKLVRELLSPFPDRNVISPQAAFIGPVARYLDMLSGALGNGAAATPSAAPGSAALRREGELWAFDLDQRSVRVRDSKGMRCIAVLLANPGVEIAAVELARPGGLDFAAAAGDAGPALDAEAKAAYRRRIEELQQDLDEAESFNDPERAERAREELEFVSRELAVAVGLGGRDRKAASNAERARVSVTKALRGTIKRLGEHDAVLGRELEATIRTGTFCVYEPDPRRPLRWQVDAAA
jgi:hypothetical protein